MFLSCPRCLPFAISNILSALSPQIGSGDPVGSLRQNTLHSLTDQALPKTTVGAPIKTTQNVDKCPKTRSVINREKLTVFHVICSFSPSEVPRIPHSRELHSVPPPSKREPLPRRLGTLNQHVNLNANSTPNPAWPQRFTFKSQSNMQMVGTYVVEPQRQQKDIDLTDFAGLASQVEIPVSWQLQGHFASGSCE